MANDRERMRDPKQSLLAVSDDQITRLRTISEKLNLDTTAEETFEWLLQLAEKYDWDNHVKP